tara:strand:- start:163 stop:927 length:765 start_codon:yes stop_codon:yes gene_type:complete
MAYNNLSGTILQPDALLPRELEDGTMANPILSGNLSTSDAAQVINVPRVSNATNNAILTNVGGDANTLTCESNFTFDGTTLQITGHVTASGGLSASYYYGDGSHLTNVGGNHISAEGPASSLQFHDPVDGGITGSATLLFSGGDLILTGAMVVNGAVAHKRVTTTDDYMISTTDYYVCADTTAGALKLTLPRASTTTSGQTFIIKDEGGAASTNPITVSGSVADTIDGQNQVVLMSPYASIQLYCNGTDKFFIC